VEREVSRRFYHRIVANMSMSAFSGTGPRDRPGGGRKGGSAQLTKMHDAVPKGGSIREVLSHVNRVPPAQDKAPPGRAFNRRWMGVVDDAPKRGPGASAWCPGGRAMVGNPAAGASAARGPHLGFKKDYHRQHIEKVDASNQKDRFAAVHYARDDKVAVRPYRGVDGLQPDYVPVWELKQPQKPGAWQPAYPKCHGDGNMGPKGAIPKGERRVGPDRVGSIVEFKQRRVDLRPHAQGHAKIDDHRISVFPAWPLPPPNEDDSRFDPDRPRTMPADPEDRSRAAAPVLNARRSTAVKRLFMAMDPRAIGKIEIRDLLTHLRPQAFKKRLDFWSRDGVLVSPDDLDEQLLGMLTSLIQNCSKDVRMQNAFMPSGTGAGGRAGRLGTLSGYVRLIELQDVYASLGCHIHDDGYFEEILENTWNVSGVARNKDFDRVENGRLEYLDINGNLR